MINHRNFSRIFSIMFVITLVAIIASWAFYAYVGYNLITDPEGAGEVVGKFINGVKK